MILNFLYCLIGFALLSYAADKLVEGASNMALSIGVSKTVIGLTIIAAGTSLPEMVVSVNASLKGSPALSLGNLVGSNIMNILLIFGVSSLIAPIKCEKQMVKRETPFMILTTAVFWYMASDKIITPLEGCSMFAIYFAYLLLSYYCSRKEKAIDAEISAKTDEISAENTKKSGIGKDLLFIIGGLVGLYFGSELLVKGAVELAKAIGLSNEIIGLTLIAIGTSLPELATSIVASRKGQSELILGNVVGSNIFNILGIVGCASEVLYFGSTGAEAVLPVSSEMLGLHIPTMFIVSLGVLPIMISGMKIVRAEGAFLIAVYIAYSIMLFQITPHNAEHEKAAPARPKAAVEAIKVPVVLPNGAQQNGK